MPAVQDFDILSEIADIEIIARGAGVDARHYLNRYVWSWPLAKNEGASVDTHQT